LRHPPGARATGISLPPGMVRQLLRSSLDGWPLPAVHWVSPEAATYVRHQAALLARHGATPTYLRACSRLLRALE
jgi:hypothetical protein